jgi:CspA family cold shock protein
MAFCIDTGRSPTSPEHALITRDNTLIIADILAVDVHDAQMHSKIALPATLCPKNLAQTRQRRRGLFERSVRRVPLGAISRASLDHRIRIMATGTVKWFNATKGFGFIQPDSGGKDVFVHISAVERAGLNGLNEGQKITYEVQQDRGKDAAVNLKV